MRSTGHEKTPATEMGVPDFTRQKLNRWPKEGDTVNTADWQSNVVLAGYPLAVEVKGVMS